AHYLAFILCGGYCLSDLWLSYCGAPLHLHSFPTRRSSDLVSAGDVILSAPKQAGHGDLATNVAMMFAKRAGKNPRELAEAIVTRSEEHTSELQSRENLVCRLLLEKKKRNAAGLSSP